MTNRPHLWSSKFMTEMRAAKREMTFTGVIVIAPSEAEEPTPVAAVLDALHLCKIDLADRISIVNPGG